VQSTGQWGKWAPQNGAAWPLGDAWQNPHRHRWVSPDDGRAKPFGELTGTGDLARAHMKRVGKKAAGRQLDGQIRDEFPVTWQGPAMQPPAAPSEDQTAAFQAMDRQPTSGDRL
jgi:hypothetical protein